LVSAVTRAGRPPQGPLLEAYSNFNHSRELIMFEFFTSSDH
jgi:hypothetical protein